MDLPRTFCWSKIGPESGEALPAILARKEREARRNGGLFLWGVGTSVGRSMPALLARSERPEALFSPIRSKPRRCDAAPDAVVAWTAARSYDGALYELPKGSVVVSRAVAGTLPDRHYALVCRADDRSLASTAGGCIPADRLVNLCTGRRLGASQVTAIVELVGDVSASPHLTYPVAMRVQLAAPYVVTLERPIIVPPDVLKRRADASHACGSDVLLEWFTHASRDSIRPVSNPALPLWSAVAKASEGGPLLGARRSARADGPPVVPAKAGVDGLTASAD